MNKAKRICTGCQRPMNVMMRDGVEIDRCANCYGLFFDAGELRDSLAKAGAEAAAKPLPVLVPDTEAPVLTCPACASETMVQGKMKAMALSQCSNCSGMFLPHASYQQLFGLKSQAARPSDDLSTRMEKADNTVSTVVEVVATLFWP